MRILIYGAGVIGSIFAGKLMAGGCDVTLLARGSRLKALQNEGLKLKDIGSGRIEHFPVNAIGALTPDDIYDFILVAMQYTQIDDVLPILAENNSPNIVFVVNNPNGYDRWKNALGNKLLVGFPACGGETKNNVTEYFVSSGLTRVFQTTTFGETDGRQTPRLHQLVKLFRISGIPAVTSAHMDNWQKCHLAVVSPIAETIYKNDGSIQTLALRKGDIKLMIRATREGFSALKELRYRVKPLKLNFYYMPLPLLCFIFSLVFKSAIAEFSMEKHAINARDEMIALQNAFENLIRETKTNKENLYRLSGYIKGRSREDII